MLNWERRRNQLIKKVVSETMLALLIISMLIFGFNIQTVEAGPTTIIVPDDYPTIQGAVNATSSGDVVYVRVGTYYERVLIKEKSISLIGENSSTTIIDSLWFGIPIEVRIAERVNVTGFTIMNSGNQWRSTMIFESWPESGILLWNSDECNISGNNITDNYFGLTIYSSWLGSWNNTVRGNLVTNNWEMGVFLSGHHETGVAYGENTIVENTIINNWKGLGSYLQADNRIYHNNFINNTSPFYLSGSMDIWDDGYPSGGNYWSNYTGIDLLGGSYQNETGSDGIGDTPYLIDIDNQDNYPLMNPWSPIMGDVNGDGIVDIFDIGSISSHWYPGPPIGPLGYNAIADINNDLAVDIFDIGITSAHWGETW